jgi:potassium efflux system protein
MRSFRKQLTLGEDVVDVAKWFPEAFGTAPHLRLGRNRWFNLLWLLPILSVACLLGTAELSLLRGQNPLPKLLSLTAAESTNPSAAASLAESPQERLARVRAALALQTGTSEGTLAGRTLLKGLERLYEQQIASIRELEAHRAQHEAVAQEAKTWQGFAEARPYSVFLTDNLRESMGVELLEIDRTKSSLSTLELLIEENRRLLKHSEEHIRQLNEQLERKPEALEASLERDLERLRSQRAAATIAVLDLDRRIREERLNTSRTRLDLLRRQLVIADAGMLFSDADFQKVRQLNEASQQNVQNELSETQARQRPAMEAVEAANQELRRLKAETGSSSSLVADAEETVALRRTQLDTINTSLSVLRFILQADSIAAAIWEARFESSQNPSADKIRHNQKLWDEFRARVALWKEYYESQWEPASRQVTLQEERLDVLDSTSSLAQLVRQRLVALRERDQLLLRVVRRIESGDRLVQRLSESLREAYESLPFGKRLRNAVADTRNRGERLWNFELFSAQDTIVVDGQRITGKRSVTLGKIISAVLILIVGYWVTILLSRLIEPIVIRRFKIEVNQASLFRRWLRVLFILILTLISLVFVKIPLSVFAFAGGALMIALGFGMQNLLKNFVSGIIILFERPFRVGDVLDVAGQRGKVVSVGIRSSVLQLFDNTETLIPNSALLENSVTNWTYSNPKVRFSVTVGVAYGTDIRRVVQLLADITGRHGLIEKDPPPQILLSEFAESALTFEARYWIDVINANSAQVASDLRQMIASVFADHAVSIAFPQRDLRLDSLQPLQIRVLSSDDKSVSNKMSTGPSVAGDANGIGGHVPPSRS